MRQQQILLVKILHSTSSGNSNSRKRLQKALAVIRAAKRTATPFTFRRSRMAACSMDLLSWNFTWISIKSKFLSSSIAGIFWSSHKNSLLQQHIDYSLYLPREVEGMKYQIQNIWPGVPNKIKMFSTQLLPCWPILIIILFCIYVLWQAGPPTGVNVALEKDFSCCKR